MMSDILKPAIPFLALIKLIKLNLIINSVYEL